MTAAASVGTFNVNASIPLLLAALAAPQTVGPVAPIQAAGVTFRSGATPSTQAIVDSAMSLQVTREMERIVAQLVAPTLGIPAEDKEILYANFWDLCE